MSGGWIDVVGPLGTRREALREGLTTVGGPGSDVALLAESTDQLHVWNRPPRALFLGRGPRPSLGGEPFDERTLRPGDRIEWCGYVLVYGGEAAAEDLATLEELPAAAHLPVPEDRGSAALGALAARVRAGLACELGLVDAAAAKRWRERVVAGTFEPDACASELGATVRGPDAERRLLERSGTLLRDFLMAALLTGARGAARKAREKTRGFLAYLVTQTLVLVLFALIFAAILIALRVDGHSIDAFLDRVIPG